MKAIIAEFMTRSIDCIPFFCMSTGGEKPVINLSKILESLITAGVISIILLYTFTNKLEVKLDNLEQDVKGIKADVRQIKRDIYIPKVDVRKTP